MQKSQSKGPDPIVIKDGPVQVKIYQTINRGADSYVVNWQTPTGRKGRTFRDLDAAKKEAKKIAGDIAKGHHAKLEVSISDVEALKHAKRSLAASGISVAVAADEVRQAMNLLQGRGTIRQAVEHFLRHGVKEGKTIPVTQAVERYLEQKEREVERRELSRAYADNMAVRLNRFARSFSIPLPDVTKEAIAAWLETANLSARNHNNYLGALSTFFSWCRTQGLLPEDTRTQAELVQKRGRARGEGKKPVWTVSELESLLEAAEDRKELKLFFVLAAASGARTDELLRQSWENFNWKEGTLNFPSSVTKTNRERTTPLQPGLTKSIKDVASPSGPLFPGIKDSKDLTNMLAPFLSLHGIKWKHNGFRHTTLSARIARGDTPAQVAEESGTSMDMLKANYQKLLTRENAEAWLNFEMKKKPEGKRTKGKIIKFKEAA